jgi:ubiquinone/menaquinone biosynthesis C-methylase UbiE/uncharacterized protein YbaR (Trm112 family)
MKPQLIDLLACPVCGQADLKLTQPPSGAVNGELSEGALTCACGTGYPVRRGIPRLLPPALSAELASAQKTFSLEWENFRSGERNWGQDMDYRRDLFIRSMGLDPASPNGGGPAELRGKRILDAGCGSGELSIEMARGLGMDVVAMDLAFGVERAQQRKGDAGVSFLQASVLDPPLQRVFDYVYCAGVLVAVPDARAGFRAITRTLKPGGRCLIWMYHPIDQRHHPDDYRKLKVYDLIRRRITSRLPIGVQRGIYSTLVPPYLAKQALSARLGQNPERLTWHEKMQQLVDFFSPLYQHRYTVEQISEWFSEEGFENITPVDRGAYGFAVRGDLARA